jgi:NitT/TauT family transport system ATP-binding protein
MQQGQTNDAPLLEVNDACQAFPTAGGGEFRVLENISMTINSGEVAGFLGRSGSGKSTFLRLIAGLSLPVSGTLRYLGKPITEPAAGIAMVFQSFALFPWMTVLENVQLGLEALRLPKDEIRRRALGAIDLIGLDGFESAYPRELSGGMRQRVGVARAVVMHPNILLMDEPFSALDVLTAETLRTDLMDLWIGGQLPIKSIILVTHNIEEAVLMCDRILVFSGGPGHIETEIKVDLARPRNRSDAAFQDIVEHIYVEMTGRAGQERPARHARPAPSLGSHLPLVSTNRLAGFLETLADAPYEGAADLPDIASELHMEIDDLFPMAELLQTLRFAVVSGGDIRLTPEGMQFVESSADDRKRIFAHQLMAWVPLVAHIRRVLDDRGRHVAPRSRFSGELEDYLSEDAAEETLRAVTSWGRYAELFAYDDEREQFTLENPS